MVFVRKTILAAATLTYLFLKRRRRRRKIRSYVRPINLHRQTMNEHAALITPMGQIDHEKYFEYFRMTPARLDELFEKVKDDLEHPVTHRLPISARQRFEITLRFLSLGGSLKALAFSFHMHESTLSKIIKETSSAIWNALQKDYLAPPSREKWIEIAREFEIKWNFPLCLGALDGKHIPIKCPPRSGSLYYNYKKFFSTVLLAVVDANYKFIYVDIGGYGSEGDPALLSQSSFGRRLDSATNSYETGGMDIPGDYYLPETNMVVPHTFLGDAAFKLQRHLLTPYSRRTTTGQEEIFNYRLSRARRVVENAFGILVSRWRVLDTKMDVGVDLADEIVKACVALHNYLKSTDATDHQSPRYVPDHYVDYEKENGEVVLGDWRRGHRDHEYAQRPLETDNRQSRMTLGIREKFKHYFLSDEGRVSWQEDRARKGNY